MDPTLRRLSPNSFQNESGDNSPSHFEGTVGGRRIILIKTGMGAAKTTSVLEQNFVAKDFGLVISAGLCGAMQKDVKSGDIVADAREIDLDLVVPLRETAQALKIAFHFGKILHTNIVLTPEAKRRLGAEQRVLACDMETSAVRRWAGAQAPVLGVRAVLDEVDQTVPEDGPAGEDTASLARFALTHATTLPSLLRLGLRSNRAMKNLSRFLTAYLGAL
jgi:nucleoside phosphorylase